MWITMRYDTGLDVIILCDIPSDTFLSISAPTSVREFNCCVTNAARSSAASTGLLGPPVITPLTDGTRRAIIFANYSDYWSPCPGGQI